jgi:hypothetical protein
MKKVRLALAAVAAVPATGLMTGPALAATPGPHHPQGATPLITNCTRHNREITTSIRSPAGHLKGTMKHGVSSNCVVFQSAALNNSQRGLRERTRFRSVNNGLVRSPTWQAGIEGGGSTNFQSDPNTAAYEVCEALVLNTATSKVVYGPVCEFT